MSAPDIGAELGLTRQTIHRFLQQLEEVGLVRRSLGRERFEIGPALAELGLKALTNGGNARLRHAVMERLVAQVRETCNLGVLDSYEVVYIDRVECDWSLRMQIKVGSRVPAHCSAIGKLLLAYLPERQLEKHLKVAPLERRTPNTFCDPDAFQQEMASIRERGYAINNQEDMLGLLAVGVPVWSAGGEVVAGLAAHGPTARLPEERAHALVPELKSAASAISELL